MSETVIRRAKPDDTPHIGKIVRRAYAHYIDRIGREPAPMTADYNSLVAAGAVWVIDVDGHVAGVMVLRINPDHVFVGNVAVDPHFQGRGLGRQLLDHADALAVSRTIPELRLHTHELMHENLAMYVSLGWTEYDRAVQDGFPRVFMRKYLIASSPIEMRV